ncbi:MAG: methyltransferase domain-containing protein [Alphaproteobacteria bacterium]|nr:methyltransferase domain-containing protein [Alphaproteobacteria bacterium]
MSEQAVYFYTRHPISAAIICERLRATRGNLDRVRPEELFAHDQDHYGGLAANDALAAAARIGAGTRVADFCAGLGGPARYLAHRYDADVTGIELTPARVAGAAELTRLVGLADRVRVLAGDVMEVPLGAGGMDAVVSQEAMLHVPDKGRALGEAFRVLKPGGRLAFTDWTLNAPLGAEDADLLWRGMAAQRLQSIAGYHALLQAAGFTLLAVDDLSRDWAVILAERLKMYQALRAEAARAGTPQGHDAFHESYVRFVALVQEGVLGGARFTAAKP